MKVLTLIARLLLGLVFAVLGTNGFLNFMPGKLPGGPAGAFLSSMMGTHYLYFVAGIQVLAGILFLLNRYMTLALVLSGALFWNIAAFHLTMAHENSQIALFCIVLWGVIAIGYRRDLAPVFASRPAGPVN